MKPVARHAHPLRPELVIYGQELEPCDVVQTGDVHCGAGRIGNSQIYGESWHLIPAHLAGKPSWACYVVTQAVIHVRPSVKLWVESALASLGAEHHPRDGWDQHVLSRCESKRGDGGRGVAFFATVLIVLAILVAACVWARVARDAPLELRIEIERGRMP